MSSVPIKFPKNPSDGDQVVDKYGNRWEFSQDDDAWLSKGVITSAPIVTEEQDGIITPDIYSKLDKLKTYVDTGVDLRPFKLLPGTDAYWYYFRSSDKLFRFTREGDSVLRVEVDRGRLFQMLYKLVCQGPTGAIGDKGPDGPDGLAAADEICYDPSAVVQNQLDFAIYTPTPLRLGGSIDLPNDHVPEISVRLFKSTAASSKVDQLEGLTAYFHANGMEGDLAKLQQTQTQYAKRALGEVVDAELEGVPLSRIVELSSFDAVPICSIEVSPDDPTDVTLDTTLDVDEANTLNSVNYNDDTGVVSGSIFLASGNWEDVSPEWCVKSRQKGPDGEDGIPGEPLIRVTECLIGDENIAATCPIINVRIDCDEQILYTMCTDLLEDYAVGKVALVEDSNLLSDSTVLDSVYAAAQMTLEESKRISRYEVQLKQDDAPELELYHWDPQPGCFTRRHYDRHKFNWIPNTDIPACDTLATWYGPESVRPGLYPHSIEMAPQPEQDECCEDNWFYCPNVQEAPLADCAPTSPSPVASAAVMAPTVRKRNRSLPVGARRWDVKS
jgi:hypothetical protein